MEWHEKVDAKMKMERMRFFIEIYTAYYSTTKDSFNYNVKKLEHQ